MTRAVCVVLAAAAALAPAAAANTVTLQPGQGFTVAGTKLVCTYGGKAGTSGGLGCRVQDASGPVVGSYLISAGATTSGVGKFTAPRKVKQLLSVRQTGAREEPKFGRDYFQIRMVAKAVAGDEISLNGGNVFCKVAQGAASAGLLGVRCGLISGGKVAIAIDESGVAIFEGDGKAATWRRKHGR